MRGGGDLMSVPQFTTPTFVLSFELEELDLTQAANVYVTFATKYKRFTKTGSDLVIGEKTIGVKLSQSETAQFPNGTIDIQANWTTASGDRAASEVAHYKISEQLLQKVIE